MVRECCGGEIFEMREEFGRKEEGRRYRVLQQFMLEASLLC